LSHHPEIFAAFPVLEAEAVFAWYHQVDELKLKATPVFEVPFACPLRPA